jgi:anti-sigma factor RsiW
MNRHLTLEEAEQYVDRHVSATDASAIEEHLLNCAHCVEAILLMRRVEHDVLIAQSEPR